MSIIQQLPSVKDWKSNVKVSYAVKIKACCRPTWVICTASMLNRNDDKKENITAHRVIRFFIFSWFISDKCLEMFVRNCLWLPIWSHTQRPRLLWKCTKKHTNKKIKKSNSRLKKLARVIALSSTVIINSAISMIETVQLCNSMSTLQS